METLTLPCKFLPLDIRTSSSPLDKMSEKLCSSSRCFPMVFRPTLACSQEDCSKLTALPAQEFLKLASEALSADSTVGPNNEPRKFLTEDSELAFIIEYPFYKSHEQIRNEYIDKLRYLKIIRQDHLKPHQTVTIFDWDDTILPTSYLCYFGLEKLSPEIEAKLQVLDRKTAKLFSKAAQVGKAYIVTNSADFWVQSSGKKYLPLTYQVIEEEGIEIISARARCAETSPRDPSKWKAEAFISIGESLNSKVPTNIICLGDSAFEMEAAALLGRRFEQALVKTVKFKECPNADELIRQTSLVLEKFDQIYTTLKTLSIRLSKKE